MSRRWRRSLQSQQVRDDADRAQLEGRITQAILVDAHGRGLHTGTRWPKCPDCHRVPQGNQAVRPS